MKRTSLAALHEARGARWMEYHGWEIPAYYSAVEEEYQALREGAGLIDLSHRGTLRITGRDRRSWLNGQVTQDIAGLPDGRGTYAAVLNPQGRMVSDLRVFALPEALLVDYPCVSGTPLSEYLDRFLIMERAEIEEVTDETALLSLQGPQSSHALASLLGEEVAGLGLWGVARFEYEGECLCVARVSECGEDGFYLFVPSGLAAALWGELCRGRAEFAVHSVGWKALNVRRLEAGIPWWCEELDESVVPLEARLDHAISRNKGCYVGQEIIARIDARGHVNNLLAGFFVHADRLPERGTELRAGGKEGKKVGSLSTAVHSLALDRPIALGYLRREYQEPGTRLEAVLPEGSPEAGRSVEVEVTALPFIPNACPPA